MDDELHLNNAELAALRDLQAGERGHDAADPVWAELAAPGLVE